MLLSHVQFCCFKLIKPYIYCRGSPQGSLAWCLFYYYKLWSAFFVTSVTAPMVTGGESNPVAFEMASDPPSNRSGMHPLLITTPRYEVGKLAHVERRFSSPPRRFVRKRRCDVHWPIRLLTFGVVDDPVIACPRSV